MNVEELYDIFGTQELCLRYEESLKKQRYIMYYRENYSSIIIRESEENENIGNRETYATIQLTDMIGCTGYSDTDHLFKFIVYIKIENREYKHKMYSTLKEAIENYNEGLELIKKLTK